MLFQLSYLTKDGSGNLKFSHDLVHASNTTKAVELLKEVEPNLYRVIDIKYAKHGVVRLKKTVKA